MDEPNSTGDCAHKWSKSTDVPSLLNSMRMAIKLPENIRKCGKRFKLNDSQVAVIIAMERCRGGNCGQKEGECLSPGNGQGSIHLGGS